MARFTHVDRVVSDYVDDTYKRLEGRTPKAQIARALAARCDERYAEHMAAGRKLMTEASVLVDHEKLTKADKALLDARRAFQAAKAVQSQKAAYQRYAAEREGGSRG